MIKMKTKIMIKTEGAGVMHVDDAWLGWFAMCDV
jgi:hypothetical protein